MAGHTSTGHARVPDREAFGIPIELVITFLLVPPLFALAIGVQVGRSADLVNGLWGAGFDAAMLSTARFPGWGFQLQLSPFCLLAIAWRENGSRVAPLAARPLEHPAASVPSAAHSPFARSETTP